MSMNFYNNRDYQRGQVLLIVVLVMVTLLTVSLSLVTRTITNVRVTQEEANSEQAFSAAEAGLEQSLSTNLQASGALVNNVTYKTSVTDLSGSEFILNNGTPVFKDDAIDIWLTNYPQYSTSWTGDVTLYWGQSTDVCSENEYDNTMAALEVIVVSGTKQIPISTRYPLDPCSSRAAVNQFAYTSPGGGIVGEKTFQYKKTIPVSSGLFIRVIPLYSSTPLAVTGCNDTGSNCLSLPSQGTIIESVGTADTVQRKIITFKGYPKLPVEIFPFVLFSPK